MAIKLENKQNTLPPSPDYPYGDVLDDDGSNNGTPVNRAVYADFHQFFAKLADASGVDLNGLPESEANGFQYFEALEKTKTDYAKAIGKDPFRYTTALNLPNTVSGFLYEQKLAPSANFLYAMAKNTSSIPVIYKLDLNISGVISQLDDTDPNYNGDAIDLFFDDDSGYLYILTQTGTQVGFLVFDEDFTYIPSLSSTNIGEPDLTASSISVTSGVVIIAGEDTPNTNGVYLRYLKSDASFLHKVNINDFYIEKVFSDADSGIAFLYGKDRLTDFYSVYTYFQDNEMAVVSVGLKSASNLFSLWYGLFYNQISKKFYQIGQDAAYQLNQLTRVTLPSKEGVVNDSFNDFAEVSALNKFTPESAVISTDDICFIGKSLYLIGQPTTVSGNQISRVYKYDI